MTERTYLDTILADCIYQTDVMNKIHAIVISERYSDKDDSERLKMINDILLDWRYPWIKNKDYFTSPK